MNDLILYSEGKALLDPDVADLITDFERKIKRLKQTEDELRGRILEEMEEKGIKKLETPNMTITYKAPFDKETFQSKEFRTDHPELYDAYVKISTNKSSIMIKLKEDTDE